MIDQHAIGRPDESDKAFADKTIIATKVDVANIAGSGAGNIVTTNVTINNLPSSYTVMVQPSQSAFYYVASKTTTGFAVTLQPPTSSDTISAGTFDVVVVA